jgi:hypothetical protein
MKIINNIAETKPTRIISTCTKDEAFRLGSNWYAKVEMSDFCIRSAKNGINRDFVEHHALYGQENVSCVALMPCIHLSSMSFVYVDGNRTAEEWATLSATLTTP